jgi:large subunit ribosomal protein L10
MATAVVEKGRLATGKAPRDDKLEAIEALQNRFNESTSLVLFDYRGLSVSQMTALRRQTREAGVRLSVVKNTIAERAVEGTDFEELRGRLVGPISIVTTDGDPAAPAKILKDFVKGKSAGEIKGGVLDGRFLETAEVESLADLPSREVLLSMLLSALQAPVAGLPRVLNGVISQFINVVDAIAKKKE